MAKKRTTERELKRELKSLRAKLERADAKADRWKAKARASEKKRSAAKAEVATLTRRLDKASRPPVTKPQTVAPVAQLPAPTVESSVPDIAWTVARLRAEARTRGVVGASRKTKAQLLALLT